MSAHQMISAEKLARMIGLPHCPSLIDIRIDEDFSADPRLIPGSVRRTHANVVEWSKDLAREVIVICHKGLKLSEGVAALLRHEGKPATVLEGGFVRWQQMGLPLLNSAPIPPRDFNGKTLWVTRSRPKVDRIACPWLIRRFVDSSAVFLFVSASEVNGVAEKFGATPFDCTDIFWSHRGDLCTFDVMLEEFGLKITPLLHLARIVRGADTANLALAPEASGLLAASLGLSRMYSDDLAQLEAGLTLYDAFYRWCRDATDETHNWPNQKKPF